MDWINDAEIDWREDVGNPPQLVAYVDDIPDISDLQFQGSEELGLWYAEHEETGYVQFFAWDGGQQEGYNGRHYEIETVDGEEVTLKGPWSSRAGVMNKAGFGPCMKALYRTYPDQLGGRTGAITLEKAEEAIDQYVEEDVDLERVERFDADEPYYIPRRGDEL